VLLSPDFWDSDEILTADEVMALAEPFSEVEIKEVVFSCYSEGVPRSDGLSFLFCHKYLDLFRLNFVMLTLIPKVENASEMKNFRPISLLNYSFKIFSKLLAMRLEKVCQRLVAKEQSAFIRSRYILENVVVAHEVVHSIHKSKISGVILKLDYKKGV
jgi:hypothetical protein